MSFTILNLYISIHEVFANLIKSKGFLDISNGYFFSSSSRSNLSTMAQRTTLYGMRGRRGAAVRLYKR